jgi:hypothetical protein
MSRPEVARRPGATLTGPGQTRPAAQPGRAQKVHPELRHRTTLGPPGACTPNGTSRAVEHQKCAKDSAKTRSYDLHATDRARGDRRILAAARPQMTTTARTGALPGRAFGISRTSSASDFSFVARAARS